ncbi:MAG: 3'-5' exonuclease [Candidatus Aenigmarchaeota archaeon]|nr:3'-5' exonuclease [Candidatus Aenigmarchaeota archaeon]
MDIPLDRPIVFIDLETTGLAQFLDRVVEVSVLKIHPDKSEEFMTTRINPEISIPPEATAIHGIADSDVVGKPTFREYAETLKKFLEGCDLGGFNIKNFDLSVLETEFKRAGSEFSREGRAILDVQAIYHRLEPRNLPAAYRKYCGKEMENHHSSEHDVRATFDIFKSQLEKHPELPHSIGALHDFCNERRSVNWVDNSGRFVWLGNEAVVNFSKYRGMPLSYMAKNEPGFLEWIVDKDFPPDTKKIAAAALRGEFPKKPQ